MASSYYYFQYYLEKRMSDLPLQSTLKELKSVRANPCVSIFVKTHRTHPDNEKDPIALKNELAEAATRIEKETDKRTADAILERIEEATANLDHNYNLDTLAIFATQEEARILRLPLNAVQRTVVGDRFALRDLIRDLTEAVHYYVLAITQESARLFEGVNDRLIKEIEGDSDRQNRMSELPFPITNTTLPTGGKSDRTGNSDDDAYLKEFANRVDKSLQQFRNIEPLPVILAGDSRTLGFYKQVCDNDRFIIGEVTNLSNLKDGDAQTIIDGVQEAVESKRQGRYTQALADLERARGDNLVRTDLQSVYHTALQGGAETLLVRRGYSIYAELNPETGRLTESNDPTAPNVSDDAIGDIIDLVRQNGGETIFMPEEDMTEAPIAVIARF